MKTNARYYIFQLYFSKLLAVLSLSIFLLVD